MGTLVPYKPGPAQERTSQTAFGSPPLPRCRTPDPKRQPKVPNDPLCSQYFAAQTNQRLVAVGRAKALHDRCSAVKLGLELVGRWKLGRARVMSDHSHVVPIYVPSCRRRPVAGERLESSRPGTRKQQATEDPLARRGKGGACTRTVTHHGSSCCTMYSSTDLYRTRYGERPIAKIYNHGITTVRPKII